MVDEQQTIRIGIAEGAILTGPGTITTTGLGSCIGLVLFDVIDHVAGMVHVMLPESPSPSPALPQKYADTGIRWLYENVLEAGANRARLKAKYAGGSQMFRGLQTEALRIGDRNIAAVAEHLSQLHIPIVNFDVGGSVGRLSLIHI